MTKKVKHRKGHKRPKDAKITAAKKAAAAKNAAVPAGEKRAASARRRMVAFAKKTVALAATKAGQSAVLEALAPVAKKINARFEQAAKADSKADDHRLAAAIHLEEARSRCEFEKISFRKWVEANVSQGYDECRKLVAVGASADPAKALADMRSGAAKRNVKLRARQKASRDATPDVVVSEGAAGVKTMTHFEAATESLAMASDRDALAAIEEKAAHLGMRVMSMADVKEFRQEKKNQPDEFATLREMQKMFRTLAPSDKLAHVKWAGALIGVTIEGDYQAGDDLEGGPDIPPSMRRGNGPRKEA